MRRYATVAVLGLLMLPGLMVLAPAVERRDPAKVDQEALIRETQRSAEPTEGMNIVWVVPVEFWKVVLSQDKTVADADRRNIIDALDDYVIVGVVRADIGPFGAMSFHGERAVRGALKVSFVDEKGKAVELKAPKEIDGDAQLLLQAMRPILAQSMGRMGENFHMLVYSDRDEKGKRLASPYDTGTLKVEMKPLGKEAGGVVEFPFPLDSLHEPRKCTQCGEPAHIRWKFCPFCGTKLPE